MRKRVVGSSLTIAGGAVATLAALLGAAARDDGRPPEAPGAARKDPGPPPGGPGGPPGGFGPGMFLAPRVVELADADKDGRVTPTEAAAAAERFVKEAEGGGPKGLDAAALGGAINRRLGPPPGGGPGRPGGPGGFMGQERKLVKAFDKDGDGRLDREERRAARASLKEERAKNPRGGGPGFGPPPGFGGEDEPAKPGPRVDPASAPAYPGKRLYDPTVLRTLFLDFEEPDWEAALEDFHQTDVDLPAALTVDGKKFPGVGVHFRGLSSYMMVRAGHKRSLNVSLDATHGKQRLDGYKTLNLLNAHEDPSFLHTVLYLEAARAYIPAPKANFVKVVINGESWGLYVNAQQFDKALTEENFPGGGGGGTRWKVRGNPGADGGLNYVGEDVEEYRRRYEIKSGDAPKAWAALIALCRALSETPLDRLEEALKPILDVEGALWFLALDDALINGDGYWVRASDYSLYRDSGGKFHVLPHDANETFGPAMGPGPGPGPGRGPGPAGGRGPGGPPGGFGPGTFLAPQVMEGADADKDGRVTPTEAAAAAERFVAEAEGGGPKGLDVAALGGAINRRLGPPPGGGPGGPGGGPRPAAVDLDPLVGLDDLRKPLRSRLLAVPALRARYLAHVRTIADDWLDWKKLGPVVARYRALIEPELAADTRRLSSLAAFRAAVADSAPAEPAPGPRPSMSLRTFADRRRDYLLNSPALKAATP